MFEKVFNAGMRYGARILFFLSIAMFGFSVLQSLVYSPDIPPFPGGAIRFAVGILLSGLMPAGYLLFGALLIERADRIIEQLRS